MESIEILKSFHLVDSEHQINDLLSENKPVLAEGAQGTMLDIDFGSYPFVTSSNTICAGACTGLGIAPQKIGRVFGIFKAYCTRVGMGPFPTELTDATGDWIVEHGNEYGTTTGRRRRCGWIDLVCLRYAARVNGFTGLALTRLDVLTGLEEIKLCVGYRLPGGCVTEDYPLDTVTLSEAQPIYETFPGWQGDLSVCRHWEELPANARTYCQRISELLGVQIDLISVGAERRDLIGLRWPI